MVRGRDRNLKWAVKGTRMGKRIQAVTRAYIGGKEAGAEKKNKAENGSQGGRGRGGGKKERMGNKDNFPVQL